MSRKWAPVDPSILGFKLAPKPNAPTPRPRANPPKSTTPKNVVPTPRKVVGPTATCCGCRRSFEMLPGCPLLDPRVLDKREGDETRDFIDPLVLDSNNECPECSWSWQSLGWCMITDDDMLTPAERKEQLAKYDGKLADGKKIRETLRRVPV